MIKQELQSNNLEDYYKDLKEVQAEAHTTQYILVHDELTKLLEDCNSYTEFGVMQGPTLALACLCGIKKIRGYDITFTWFNKAKDLFTTYASENTIDFKTICESSLTCNIDSVDLLYIDSVHTYHHLKQELNIHHKNVNKYIVMHDTTGRPELVPAINEFLHNNSNWERITECRESVGFTTIRRIK